MNEDEDSPRHVTRVLLRMLPYNGSYAHAHAQIYVHDVILRQVNTVLFASYMMEGPKIPGMFGLIDFQMQREQEMFKAEKEKRNKDR